jgi:hypothetical protein
VTAALTREQMVPLAHSWASFVDLSDPGVQLYALASTGRIQSEGHRRLVLEHLDGRLRRAADVNIRAGEYLDGHRQLDALRAYVAAAPVEAAPLKLPNGSLS